MASSDPELPETVAEALLATRPEPEVGLTRRLALGRVLAAVLGQAGEDPRIGRFVVERKIGAGGMGVVYRARDPENDRTVAIKVLDRAGPAERARFVREAMLLGAIDHPGVVRYLDRGATDEGVDYLVMEWLDGRDLAQRLERGRLAVRDALRLVLRAAEGLGAAHAAGVIHRDVKPSNLFLVGDDLEDLRVVDFGIARSVVPGTRLTASGAVMGTPQYMAPEQLRGEHDFRTDVYGLGATLFECLTGRAPFTGAHPAAVMLAVSAEPPPSCAALRPEISPGLDALVGRMLAKRVDHRPIDMRAVVTEVSHLLSGGTPEARFTAVLSRAERPGTPRQEPTRPRDQGALLGRARELAQIGGLLDESLEEQQASLVFLRGAAGSGKSRLLDAVTARKDPFSRLRARASSEETGLPFALLGRLIASDEASHAARERFVSLLAAVHPGGGASLDPLLAADRLQLAWLDLLEEASARGPLLWIVDDAHLADLSSMRFLDRALNHLCNRPLVVLATTRSGEDPAGLGAAPSAARLTTIALGPLQPRSAAALAASWAPTASPRQHEEAARLSGGNPAHLSELCRALSEGRPLQAASLAELLWQRLERLDPEARRVLRAAAIVGREVWPGAIAALLGLDQRDAELTRQLNVLVTDGWLSEVARSLLRGEPQLAFANQLVHLAAYEMSTDEDRQRGHLAMTRWLAARPDAPPAALGRHLAAAGDRPAAAAQFVAAARATLAGEDARLFDEQLRLAKSLFPGREVAAEIAALETQGSFWRGRMDETLAAATTALAVLPRDQAVWFRMADLGIAAAGQLGHLARLDELTTSVLTTSPSAAAVEARAVGLCRSVMQRTILGVGTSEPVWSALAALSSTALGAEGRAFLARARAAHAGGHDFDAAIDAFVEAHRGHVEASDLRAAANVELFLAYLFTRTGAFERAREHIDNALGVSRRLGVAYLELWGRYTEGKLLSEIGSPAEALATLDAVVERTADSPRTRGGALVYAAVTAQRADQLDLAVTLATRARAIPSSPLIAAGATAALCRALVAAGRAGEAAPLLPALRVAADGEEGLVEFDELVRLALAELDLALGGQSQLLAAQNVIEARARTLREPLRRNEYLARPHLVVRTLALAPPLVRESRGP